MNKVEDLSENEDDPASYDANKETGQEKEVCQTAVFQLILFRVNKFSCRKNIIKDALHKDYVKSHASD